jgi:predicted phosphodiesterase
MARVLVMADTHCPAAHPDYFDFISDMNREWRCDTCVHIGDLADFSAISFHERHPSHPSAHEEISLARKQIQKLYKLFPRTVVMVGNHDALPERQARVAGLPSELLIDYASLWETPKWRYVPRFGFTMVDNVLYQHGDKGKQGQHAAYENAKEQFCSVVQGHLHSQASVSWICNETSRCFGMQVGSGIDYNKLAFEYGRKFNHKPIISCGIVIDGRHAFVELTEL